MRLGASVLTGLVAGALALSTAIATLTPASAEDSPAVGPAAATSLTGPSGSTTFRIATFNVLGNSHTTAGGDESDRPSGTKRMPYAVQALAEGNPSIIGFQEMESVQYAAFKQLTGSTYGTYPGPDADQLVVANNIAWRTDTWRLLSATTFTAPYFYGKFSRRPLVLLQNIHTGQRVYVMNTHNPADLANRGNALAYRNQAVQIEAALITRLRSTHPDIPVLFTGDMNDWSNFYCPITAQAPVHSAYGGSHVLTPVDQCNPPTISGTSDTGTTTTYKPIDWIVGSPDVSFSGATRLKDATVSTASDHPLYWADATVDVPPAPTGVRHVVAIDLEGLSSAGLAKGGAKFLGRLRAAGASTLDARTEPDSTRVLPNAIGMLSGRKVLKSGGGGHGVKGSHDDGSTVAKRAGGYVASAYDVVHDFGHSTALYSSDPDARLIERTWARHGARDRVGADNGRNKLSKVVLARSDDAATAAFTAKAGHLKAFSFVQLTGAVRAGERSGWSSAAYRKAVKGLDHRVRRIVRAIQAHPATAASTVVIITASAGGHHHSTAGSKPANYRVPFIVWGHGVPGGTDLHALNPSLLAPGSGNPGLTVGQPVRNAMVGDLATSLLGLPAIRGSILDSGQDLNVLHAPVAALPPDPANQPSARR